MTEYFKFKRWVIAGPMASLTRKEATAQLKARGATVTGTVSSRTDFLVSVYYDPNDPDPDGLSVNDLTALQHHIPIFNEQQLLAILDGASDKEIASLAAPALPAETLPTRDVLEAFRGLVYGPMDTEKWGSICASLDKCQPSDLPLVIDYLEGNLSEDALDVDWPRYPLYRWMDDFNQAEPRNLPRAWAQEVLRGRDHPKFGLVRVADLRGQGVKGKLGAQMLSCSHLKNLVGLNLNNNPVPIKTWKAIAQAPQLAGLKMLGIGESKFNTGCAEALTKARFSDNLTHMMLGELTFQKGAAEVFFGSEGAWPSLRALQLEGTRSLGADLHTALARASNLHDLRHLSLRGIEGTHESFADLMRAPHLSELRYFALSRTMLRRPHFQALAEATHLKRLEHLVLRHDPFSWLRSGMELVVQAPHLASLGSMNLSLNRDAMRSLVAAHHLRELRHLSIESTPQQDEQWWAFFSAPHLSNLETLVIDSGLPSALIGRFLASDLMPNLKIVRFPKFSAYIGDDALRELMGATHRANLEELSINLAKDTTASVIREALDAPHLPEEGFKYTLRWNLAMKES